MPWNHHAWLAVRVLAADFEEIGKLLEPENHSKFLGTCGQPLSWAPDAKVNPVKSFCKGYRRTWVVRAADQPTITESHHDFGLAVIRLTAMQNPPGASDPEVDNLSRRPGTPSSKTHSWQEVSKAASLNVVYCGPTSCADGDARPKGQHKLSGADCTCGCVSNGHIGCTAAMKNVEETEGLGDI